MGDIGSECDLVIDFPLSFAGCLGLQLDWMITGLGRVLVE